MNHSTSRTASTQQPDGAGVDCVRGRRRSQGGFSLIEIIAALALFTIVIGGIFKVASACFEMNSSVTLKSQQEMHIASFFDLMRRNFSAMPGNGKITMELGNGVSSSGYQSEIVLTDYPLAFSWGGVAAGSERVLIVSEKDPLGALQVKIRYLNEEEAEKHESGGLGENEGQNLVLIDGIKDMYWQFFDQNEEEWVREWEEENRRPSLVELWVEFHSLEKPVRSVLWIPVVANPESVVRGAQTSRGVGGSRSGGRTRSGTDRDGRPIARPPGGSTSGRPSSGRPSTRGGSTGGGRPGGSGRGR